MRSLHRSRWMILAATGALAAASAVAVGVEGTTSASKRASEPPQFGSHAVLASSVSDALSNTTSDISFVHAVVTRGSVVVSDTSTWVDPDGSARAETFSTTGNPLTDEAISSTGVAQVIDYTRQAWWTLPSPVHLGAPDVEGLISDLQSGALKPSGERSVSGRTYLELEGSPKELPTGSTVVLLVNPATYLPVSATDIEPGATVQEELSWNPVTPQWSTQLSVAVPAGFVHLTSPPSGVVSNGVG